MRRVILGFVVTLGLVAGTAAAWASVGGETCFSKGEKTDGQNKICYYSCPSGEAAITVKGYQLCPLNIKR